METPKAPTEPAHGAHAAAPAAPAAAAAPSVTVIYHRSCSECQLVREALDKQKVAYRLRDMYDDPLSREDVAVLLEGVEDVRPFLNPRSTEYRDRRLGQSPPARDLVIELISREPRLLRCPVLLKGEEAMPVVIETEATVVPADVWKFLGVEIATKKATPHAKGAAAKPAAGAAAAAKPAAAAPQPAPKAEEPPK